MLLYEQPSITWGSGEAAILQRICLTNICWTDASNEKKPRNSLNTLVLIKLQTKYAKRTPSHSLGPWSGQIAVVISNLMHER